MLLPVLDRKFDAKAGTAAGRTGRGTRVGNSASARHVNLGEPDVHVRGLGRIRSTDPHETGEDGEGLSIIKGIPAARALAPHTRSHHTAAANDFAVQIIAFLQLFVCLFGPREVTRYLISVNRWSVWR